MNPKASAILERVAVSGLEGCLDKLSKVSAGTWKIAGTGVSVGTLADAVKRHDFKTQSAAAVYFNVPGGFPFTAIMFFEPDDIGSISKCFMGYSFSRARRPTQPEEVMLLELGNIILNSLVNSVLNALKRSCLPMLPRYAEGDPRSIEAAIGSVVDPKQNFRILTVTLAIGCGKCVGKSEVLAMIPDGLAAELEKT
jgi:hypothetical protein